MQHVKKSGSDDKKKLCCREGKMCCFLFCFFTGSLSWVCTARWFHGCLCYTLPQSKPRGILNNSDWTRSAFPLLSFQQAKADTVQLWRGSLLGFNKIGHALAVKTPLSASTEWAEFVRELLLLLYVGSSSLWRIVIASDLSLCQKNRIFLSFKGDLE